MDWPNSSPFFPERSSTKSSISSFENSRSPNTASENFVVPPTGALKRTAGFTPGVDGLDADDHRAALVPREEPVKQRLPGSSHVQITGGGRGKTHSHGRWFLNGITHMGASFHLNSNSQFSQTGHCSPIGLFPDGPQVFY